MQMVAAVGKLEARMQKIMEADMHQKAANVLGGIDYYQLLTGERKDTAGDQKVDGQSWKQQQHKSSQDCLDSHLIEDRKRERPKDEKD